MKPNKIEKKKHKQDQYCRHVKCFSSMIIMNILITITLYFLTYQILFRPYILTTYIPFEFAYILVFSWLSSLSLAAIYGYGIKQNNTGTCISY